MTSHRVATMTRNEFDTQLQQGVSTLLQQAIPHWHNLCTIEKKSGGIHLWMLPHHAQRLLHQSGWAVQDSDNTLLVATTLQSRDLINHYLKNTYVSAALCLPKRFVQVERCVEKK